MSGAKQRLVMCQGATNLLAAATVARVLDQRSSAKTESHLLIGDLATARAHTNEHASYTELLAHSLHSWKSVTILSSSEKTKLLAIASGKRIQDVRDALLSILGLPQMDELLLPRNWQSLNTVLLHLFPDAHKVCYGDSIGIFFEKGYFREVRGFSRIKAGIMECLKLPGRMVQRIRERFFDEGSFERISFDQGLFLLPEVLGFKPDMPYERIDLSIFRESLKRVTPDRNAAHMLRKLLSSHKNSPWVLFLSSNFSEQGIITKRYEIAAYVEWINAEFPRGTPVVIRAHPRDRGAKVSELKEAFVSSGYPAIALPNRYEPIEIQLSALAADPDFSACIKNLKVAACSTACFGPRALWGVETRVGLGDELVRRYMVAEVRASRCKHEHDLRAGLNTLDSDGQLMGSGGV